MSIFNLMDDTYLTDNKRILESMPTIKFRFKDMLSCGGKKYSYDDLSKCLVDYTDSSTAIIPQFLVGEFGLERLGVKEKAQEKTEIVDMAPVYCIGLLELLHLAGLNNKSQSIIYTKLTDGLRNVFSTYADVEKVIKELDNDDSDYTESWRNILYLMRTDYQSVGYKAMMELVGSFFVIWWIDKRKFYQMMFEILEFVQPMMPLLMAELFKEKDIESFNEGITEYKKISERLGIPIKSTQQMLDKLNDIRKKVTVTNTWLSDDDTHFKRMGYTVPNSSKKTKHYITDCRGVAIHLCLCMWFGMLYSHGEFHPTKYTLAPYYDYDTPDFVITVLENMAKCIGDDLQSEVLQGKTYKLARTNRNCFSTEGRPKYKLREGNATYTYSRDYYEDYILFRRAYKISYRKIDKEITHLRDVNMHYISAFSLTNSCTMLMMLCSDLTPEKEVKKIMSLETELKDTKRKLNYTENKLARVETELTQLQDNNIHTSEYEELKSKFEEVQRLLESKNDIIEKIVTERDDLLYELNKYYENDEDFEDTYVEIPLEDKIAFLNDFKFVMIGGMNTVDTRLAEMGWNNLNQISDVGMFRNDTTDADFFVVHTRFVSHKLVRALQSNYSNLKDNIVFYKGTNLETLVSICYKLVYDYLNS